jgi:hypothetical protein
MTLEDFVSELASNKSALRELARLVAAELGDMKPEEAVYTSIALPPDCPSRKRFRELVQNMPGAVKRGNAWVIGKSTWEERRSAAFARPIVTLTPEMIADAALKAAGYRKTK